MSAAHPRRCALLIAVLAALVVASVGGLITDLGPWYQSLQQPAWKPPDGLFAPGWTVIFGLTALSGYLAWRGAPSKTGRRWVITFFALNAGLNIAWSLFFFRFQRPDWALLEVGLLWLSIAMLIVLLRRFSTAASLLLLPYLAWVTFAGALNYAVVQLNGPFG